MKDEQIDSVGPEAAFHLPSLDPGEPHDTTACGRLTPGGVVNTEFWKSGRNPGGAWCPVCVRTWNAKDSESSSRSSRAEQIAALTSEWQRRADLPGSEDRATKRAQYDAHVEEGIAERQVCPVLIAGKACGANVYYRLAPSAETWSPLYLLQCDLAEAQDQRNKLADALAALSLAVSSVFYDSLPAEVRKPLMAAQLNARDVLREVMPTNVECEKRWEGGPCRWVEGAPGEPDWCYYCERRRPSS